MSFGMQRVLTSFRELTSYIEANHGTQEVLVAQQSSLHGGLYELSFGLRKSAARDSVFLEMEARDEVGADIETDEVDPQMQHALDVSRELTMFGFSPEWTQLSITVYETPHIITNPAEAMIHASGITSGLLEGAQIDNFHPEMQRHIQSVGEEGYRSTPMGSMIYVASRGRSFEQFIYRRDPRDNEEVQYNIGLDNGVKVRMNLHPHGRFAKYGNEKLVKRPMVEQDVSIVNQALSDLPPMAARMVGTYIMSKSS